MGDRFVFDIETDNLLPKLTTLHCLVMVEIETGEMVSVSRVRDGEDMVTEALQRLASADLLVGHNVVGFDVPALKKLYPWWTPVGTIRDTLLLGRLLEPDQGLLRTQDARRASRRTNNASTPSNPYSLDAWGWRLGSPKAAHSDWSVWSPEMQQYCEQDVRVNVKLWEHLQTHDLPDDPVALEHDFATIIQRQVQRGFRFDTDAAGRLYADLAAKRNELTTQLQAIFPHTETELKTAAWFEYAGTRYATKTEASAAGERHAQQRGITKAASLRSIVRGPNKVRREHFNPGSDQQIVARLREKYNWTPTVFTKKGSPQLTDVVLGSLPFPEAKPLAEYRDVVKKIGMVADGAAGWMKLVQEDGRLYGNVHTIGCVTSRCSHSGPNLAQVPAGREYRRLFTVADGHQLVGADASGLGLRCLAHYMGRFDGGAYGRILLDGDIHTANQQAAGLPTRNQAKTFIYGLLYGAGDGKIGEIVGGSAKEGARLRERFLANLPALGALVHALQSASQKGWIRGIDGRRIPIRHKHAVLNTLLQSAGAIAMKRALVVLDKMLYDAGLVPGEHYEFVANVHDEFQAEVRHGYTETFAETSVLAIRASGEYYGFRCPLDGEAKVGQTWAETH